MLLFFILNVGMTQSNKLRFKFFTSVLYQVTLFQKCTCHHTSKSRLEVSWIEIQDQDCNKKNEIKRKIILPYKFQVNKSPSWSNSIQVNFGLKLSWTNLSNLPTKSVTRLLKSSPNSQLENLSQSSQSTLSWESDFGFLEAPWCLFSVLCVPPSSSSFAPCWSPLLDHSTFETFKMHGALCYFELSTAHWAKSCVQNLKSKLGWRTFQTVSSSVLTF